MRRRHRLALVGAVVAVGVLLISVTAASANDISATCTSGGSAQTCNGSWYAGPVSVVWQATPPPDSATCALGIKTQFTSDTITKISCAATWGTDGGSSTYTLHVEASNPTAAATPSRPPDSNGWYNHPFSVSFRGAAFSGIAACTAVSTYAGPDTLSTNVAGTCIDHAGKVAGASVPVHYDATPPTITSALASRPPDHDGWYTHPVTFAFAGTDATSGVSGCTNIAYAAPSSASASVVGSCVDRAGNVARMAVPLHYDATAPSLSVSAGTGDGFTALSWKTGTDVAPLASIEVARKPGRRGADSSVVYRGKAGAFRDNRVGNGKRYRYTITATDQAGNESTRVIRLTAGPHLISPGDGARLSAPPLLTWTSVRRATYYNVQLFRGRKLMSTWPEATSLQLKRRWQFDGHHYRLRPGRYKWFVWPGYGERSAGRYGRAVGSGTFVVSS